MKSYKTTIFADGLTLGQLENISGYLDASFKIF